MNTEEDSGESAMAAQGCLTTIGRIVKSCKHNKDLLSKLEMIIREVIEYSIQYQGRETMEEAVECISVLIYYNGTSSNLWQFYPELVNSICMNHQINYGFEFISRISIALQNYI